MSNYTLEWVFWLMIIVQFKHFLADFVFQNVYMLKKGRSDWGFLLPLAVHAGIHALLTLILVLAVNASLWWLAVLDFVVHFAVDRLKAGPRYLGRYNDSHTKIYWIIYGADQLAHHLTHIFIVWILVTRGMF